MVVSRRVHGRAVASFAAGTRHSTSRTPWNRTAAASAMCAEVAISAGPRSGRAAAIWSASAVSFSHITTGTTRWVSATTTNRPRARRTGAGSPITPAQSVASGATGGRPPAEVSPRHDGPTPRSAG